MTAREALLVKIPTTVVATAFFHRATIFARLFFPDIKRTFGLAHMGFRFASGFHMHFRFQRRGDWAG